MHTGAPFSLVSNFIASVCTLQLIVNLLLQSDFLILLSMAYLGYTWPTFSTTFMAGLGLEVTSLLGTVYFVIGKNRITSTHSPNEYLAVTMKSVT